MKNTLNANSNKILSNKKPAVLQLNFSHKTTKKRFAKEILGKSLIKKTVYSARRLTLHN